MESVDEICLKHFVPSASSTLILMLYGKILRTAGKGTSMLPVVHP